MTPRQKARYIMYATLLVLLIFDAACIAIYSEKGYLDISLWAFVGIPLFLILNSFLIFERYLEKQSKELNEYNVSIDELIKLIETKFDDAKSAANKKSEFLSKMSHEIRTPINSVLGMNEMIIRESSEEHIVDYAVNVRNAGRMLLSLINDILDFSKIESGKMELVPVEYHPASLVNDLVNMTRSRMEGVNLEFILNVSEDIPCVVLGDDVRIKQVLVNLLTNAIKYTKEGSITLDISGEQADNFYRFRFAVSDTGIGIAPENIDSLTKEFVRVDLQRNRQIEGTGLGLAITSQLIGLMGGKLEIKSTPGVGSTFSFEVEQKIVDFTPMGEFVMTQETASVNYRASFEAKDATILVVDDTPTNREVVKGLLRETKIRIEEADSGESCLAKIHDKKYELILMDHMMPGMDGVETLHKIKDSVYHYNVDTPIVVLTANAVSGMKEKYLAEGFDGYISKPIIPEKLEDVVGMFIPKELKTGVKKLEKAKTDNDKFIEDMPQIDGLDWHYGYSHFGDEGLLKDAVQSYYRALPGEIQKLSNLLESVGRNEDGALDGFRIQIHSMKSAANIIGLISLGGMAAVLEGLSKDLDQEKILATAPVFIGVATDYVDKLSVCVKEESKSKITDTSELVMAFNQLKEAVELIDVDVADSIIVFLRGFEYVGELKDLFSRLEAAVVDLDSTSCDEIIEDILARLK